MPEGPSAFAWSVSFHRSSGSMESEAIQSCGCCTGLAGFLAWCCNFCLPHRQGTSDSVRDYTAAEAPLQEAGPSNERTSPERHLLLPKGQASSSMPGEPAASGTRFHMQQSDGSSTHSKGCLQGSAADLAGRNVTPRKGSKLDAKVKQVPSGLSLASDDEDSCSTCLEGYDAENPKIWTQCGHHFHLACIYEWLNRKQTCPICGLSMSFDELL